jgi:branched-chain amino acid transport system ATP-binding protein
MTSDVPILKLEEVSVAYGQLVALNAISVELHEGSALAVVGANGAGKSSLGRALAGLVRASSGRILMDSCDISHWSADRIRRNGLTYLPEGRGVFPTLTVMENLRVVVRWVKSREERQESIERMLELFPVLKDRCGQRAGTLSGGEQQMLSLARGLAVTPRILIADELSLGLAPKIVDVVFEQLELARQLNVTVIVIEQFIHRALDFADDLMILNQGSVVWHGPVDSISHKEIVHRYMGEANVNDP